MLTQITIHSPRQTLERQHSKISRARIRKTLITDVRNRVTKNIPLPTVKSLISTVNDSESVNFYAGRLKDYIQVWEALGAPNHILKLIGGYRIPFQEKPPLQNPNLLKRFQTPTSLSMSEQIMTLKNQKVLIPVKLATPSFVSPMFLIKKSDSSNRPIFDLQNLNDYV